MIIKFEVFSKCKLDYRNTLFTLHCFHLQKFPFILLENNKKKFAVNCIISSKVYFPMKKTECFSFLADCPILLHDNDLDDLK